MYGSRISRVKIHGWSSTNSPSLRVTMFYYVFYQLTSTFWTRVEVNYSLIYPVLMSSPLNYLVFFIRLLLLTDFSKKSTLKDSGILRVCRNSIKLSVQNSDTETPRPSKSLKSICPSSSFHYFYITGSWGPRVRSWDVQLNYFTCVYRYFFCSWTSVWCIN